MKALSIRQPWAWLILHGGKDIENRVWMTGRRGRHLIHAAKGMTAQEWEDGIRYALGTGPAGRAAVAAMWGHYEEIRAQRGGIVGSVEIVDCVQSSASAWFTGPWGFVMAKPVALPFVPYCGQLGFFDVPDECIPGMARSA
jgi:hypothetical protein